jgi:hypothetical protein
MERICDACGQKKKVRGGQTCARGHFICKGCVFSGVIVIHEKNKGPVCGDPLR